MQLPEKSSREDARRVLSRALDNIREKHILGVWDTKAAAPQLGAVLIMLAELSILKRSGAKAASLAFVGSDFAESLANADRMKAMTGVANSVTAIARCMACTDIAEAKLLLDPVNPESIASWPAPEIAGYHSYESMEIIQDLYELTREFPLLELREDALARARRLLDECTATRTRVAVHLKMSAPFENDISNADMRAWAQFFREVGSEAIFVLVGQDPVPDSIAGLDNVVVSQRVRANAVDQLCLIRLCDAFMGMASGPCQIAIFGPKPYAVFKNPGHHPEEMSRQMRTPLGFSFSLPFQSLIRQKETHGLLLSQFESLLRGASVAMSSDKSMSSADE